MVKIFFIVIGVFNIFQFEVFSQVTKTYRIPSDYCFSKKNPLEYHYGDTLIITCDTAFFINNKRFTHYNSLEKKINILQQKDSLSKVLLSITNNMLKEHEGAFQSVFDNSTQSDKITNEMMDYTKKKLEIVDKNLVYTQQTLDQSLQSLEYTNRLLRQQQWNSIGQKFLIGGGCLGIGLLVGILFGK